MQKGSAALFLLVVAIVVGIFIVLLVNRAKVSITQLPVKIPAVPKIPGLPSPTPFIYSDSALGFEVQYFDKDLKVVKDSEEDFNKRGNGNYRKNFTGYVGYEPPVSTGAVVVLDKDGSFDKNPLSVWVFSNDNNLTIEQFFQKYWYYPFVWGVFDYTSKGHIALDSEATVSGQLAKYKIISYQPGKPKFVYVAKENKMYLFRVIGEKGEKILSDFRFN